MRQHHSRFAHFQTDLKTTLVVVDTQWLPTTEAASFAQLLDQLRTSDFPLPIEAADIAVIAVAGPVEHGSYCVPPYISWDIDLASETVSNTFQRAVLINDFVAQAYACRSPVGESVRIILPGEIVAGGTVGIIGAGTALGKAILLPVSSGEFQAWPSEGGHGYFPFLSQQEFAFQEFYQRKERTKPYNRQPGGLRSRLGLPPLVSHRRRVVSAGSERQAYPYIRNPGLGSEILWTGLPGLCP